MNEKFLKERLVDNLKGTSSNINHKTSAIVEALNSLDRDKEWTKQINTNQIKSIITNSINQDELINKLVEALSDKKETKKQSLKESVEPKQKLNEGTSNFGNMIYLPLLAFYVYDEDRDEDSYDEKVCILDNSEVEDLVSDLEEFNDETKEIAYELDIDEDGNQMYGDGLNLEDITLEAESGYYDGAYIKCNNEKYFDYLDEDVKKAQIERFTNFLNEMKSKYGLTQLKVGARFSNGETWYDIDESLDDTQNLINDAKKFVKENGKEVKVKGLVSSNECVIDTFPEDFNEMVKLFNTKFDVYDEDSELERFKIKVKSTNENLKESEDEIYIYQFPKDINLNYVRQSINLTSCNSIKLVGKVGKGGDQPGDILISGTKADLEKFADDYFDYTLNPDYLYEEDEFDTSLIKPLSMKYSFDKKLSEKFDKEEIKKDIERRFTKEDLDNYSTRTLTFAYLMGMKPEDCEGMDVEPEFTEEQLNEYDEVNGIVYEIQHSLGENLKEDYDPLYDALKDSGKSPMFEFDDGTVYGVEYKDGKLYAGSITNNGIMREYELEYDNDLDIDANLQNLYDKIIEGEPNLLGERLKEDNNPLARKMGAKFLPPKDYGVKKKRPRYVYEVYWYTDEDCSDDPIFKKFPSNKAREQWYEQHKDDPDKFSMCADLDGYNVNENYDVTIKDKKTGETKTLKNRTDNQLDKLEQNKNIDIVSTEPIDEKLKEDREKNISSKSIKENKLKEMNDYFAYMDKDYADLLDSNVDVYDIKSFVEKESNGEYTTHYTDKYAIIVCANGKGCVVDYEAVGQDFDSVDSEIRFGIVENKDGEYTDEKGVKHRTISLVATHNVKTTPKEVMEKAPKETMKYRDFFRKYNYNDRCAYNFKDLAKYINANNGIQEGCNSKKKSRKLKEGYIGQTLYDFLNDCIDPDLIENVNLWGDDDVIYEGDYEGAIDEYGDNEFIEFDCGMDKVVVNVDTSVQYQITDYYVDVQDFIDFFNGDEIEVYDLNSGETLFSGYKDECPDDVLEKIFISFDAPKFISINIEENEDSDDDDDFDESLKEGNNPLYRVVKDPKGNGYCILKRVNEKDKFINDHSKETFATPEEAKAMLDKVDELHFMIDESLKEDHLEDREKLDFNLKDWYLKEYPDDELGKELNSDITLKDVYVYLSVYGGDGNNEYKDLYDYIGVGDSIVRERIFDKIANILGVDYDVIYHMWLGRGLKDSDILAFDENLKEDNKSFNDKMDFLAKDEDEAIDGYKKVIPTIDNKNVKTQLKKIETEEKAHKDYLTKVKSNKDIEYTEPLEEDTNLKCFKVTLKHDKGTKTIKTTATSEEQAKKQVLDSEKAPESAIVKVENCGNVIKEDTVKQDGKWVNKGNKGDTHGTFKTKKEADAQRKAMFVNKKPNTKWGK